ncbi:MAG TPA: hypothetical protein PK989_13715 [Anaerolineales bacterium]|nr:hypothetical protein [Anaerolineales bacterium]
MNKFLSILLTIFVVGYVAPIACVPGDFLSGTAGQGDTPPSKVPESDGNPIGLPSTPVVTTNFYSPTLVIIQSKNNYYETAISIPPMGTAEYELTTPKVLQIGQESFIKLVLVPDTLPVAKNKISQDFEKDLIQSFQGNIAIYPHLKAEVHAGSAFSIISPLKPDQIITMNYPSKWIWYITALKAGEHKVSVNISVPVLDGETTVEYPLESIDVTINIPMPTPTPTVTFTPVSTLTPIPTLTSTPSIGEQLSGSAVEITLAIITVSGSIIVAIIGFLAIQQNRTKKKEEEKEKNIVMATDKRHKNVKDNLPSTKKSKEDSQIIKKSGK